MKPSERLEKVYRQTSSKILKTETTSQYQGAVESQNVLMFMEIGNILDEIVEPVELPKEEMCRCGSELCSTCVKQLLRILSKSKEESLRDGETKVSSGGTDEFYLEWFKCEKCSADLITEDSNFCPGCGRKIIRTPN